MRDKKTVLSWNKGALFEPIVAVLPHHLGRQSLFISFTLLTIYKDIPKVYPTIESWLVVEMVAVQQAQQDPNVASTAGNGQQPEVPAAVEDVWDEERLEKSLKSLKEMHIQVRSLACLLSYWEAFIDSVYSSELYGLPFHDSLRLSPLSTHLVRIAFLSNDNVRRDANDGTNIMAAEKLFREFSASASTANKEVQEFKRLMADEDSKKVLEQARKSRAEKPQGIKPWFVTEHPDWLTRET